MTAYDIVEAKIQEGMTAGNLHACRRDIGRLAGGYAASGLLTAGDLQALRSLAIAKSKTKMKASEEWEEAVAYGRQQPIQLEERRPSREMGWDDAIHIGGTPPSDRIVDARYVDSVDVPEPGPEYDPVSDMIAYLEAVFAPDDHVGIVHDAFRPEGTEKWLPKGRGDSERTRQELVSALRSCRGDIGSVLGDTEPDAGAWVRINPLDDSGGAKDANVTAYRHTLVEADDADLGRQLALIRELQLPCSVLVHSGGKSIHALVRVDAGTAAEYRERVNRIYEICEANGLKVDTQCRNPSRLSRLPGIQRGAAKQYLISGPCGIASYEKWIEHVEAVNDDLPDFEDVPATREALPALAPSIIDGVLREGHKLRLSGASKAGKSFALLELAAAMAEGTSWLGWPVQQGNVLYCNFELDGRSVMHRIHAVYEAQGLDKANLHRIKVWNLRGVVCPLDQLAAKLIRRAQQSDFQAIIFDPIYKIQTGNEMDPADVARFCNLLDHIARKLNVAIIDCHHHSKGQQGQKRAMDRASGSGVFGRDPDAILDMIELDLSGERRRVLVDELSITHLRDLCDREGVDFARIAEGSRYPANILRESFCCEFPGLHEEADAALSAARLEADNSTAWRIEGNLREFPSFAPVRVLFRYPIHRVDTSGLLEDAKAAGEEAPWQSEQRAKAEAKAKRAEESQAALEEAVEAAGGPGEATVSAVAEALGKDPDTVRRMLGRKGSKYRFRHGLILDKLSVD